MTLHSHSQRLCLRTLLSEALTRASLASWAPSPCLFCCARSALPFLGGPGCCPHAELPSSCRFCSLLSSRVGQLLRPNADVISACRARSLLSCREAPSLLPPSREAASVAQLLSASKPSCSAPSPAAPFCAQRGCCYPKMLSSFLSVPFSLE